MAIYLITAGVTPTGSGLLETEDGLVLDFSVIPATGYVTTVGDGTNTDYVVTHNLGTRDVLTEVIRSASPYDTVIADVAATTTNTITVSFASAPTTNEFRVVISPTI